jgi:hypothetical protein
MSAQPKPLIRPSLGVQSRHLVDRIDDESFYVFDPISMCLIPRFDGAMLSQEWREALWDKFVTGAPRSSHGAPLGQAPWRGHAVRAAIQRSVGWHAFACKRCEAQASLAQLSQELRIDPKTVAKWRKRATVEDMKTGPTEPQSTVLTEAEEAMIVAFRRHTLLPLDDCLYALHRCLQRHGISRLPDVEGDKPKRQKFKRYPIRWPAGDACIAVRRLLPHRHRRGADC